MNDPASVRIDVWLWSVRMFKSRSLATAAVKAGHVRVDGAGVKPSAPVRPGMRVTVTGGPRPRILVVQKLLSKRVELKARVAMISHCHQLTDVLARRSGVCHGARTQPLA